MTAGAAALLAALLAAPAQAATPAPPPGLSADDLLRDHLWREVRRAPPEARARTGLVLSAGSLRGFAHVGVIKVLENAGFPIDAVAGTSMGAVVGAYYAAGLPVPRMWELALSTRVRKGREVTSRKLLSLLLFDSLLSSQGVEEQLRRLIGERRFDQLPRPFACVAMDVHTGEGLIFREGPVAPAVRASMNLPGIFQPVEYRHRFLVDGGVVDYIPVDAAKLLGAEWILASVTENDYTVSRPKSVLESLLQVIDIRGAYLSREQRRQADFLIEPKVGDIGMFEEERVPEALEKGVAAAAARLRGAQESLILASLPRLAARWRTRAP